MFLYKGKQEITNIFFLVLLNALPEFYQNVTRCLPECYQTCTNITKKSGKVQVNMVGLRKLTMSLNMVGPTGFSGICVVTSKNVRQNLVIF